MIRITAAASETILAAANEYAMCIGQSIADGETYQGLNWKDAGGNLYAAMSFMASEEWIIHSKMKPTRPSWDTSNAINMELAIQGWEAAHFISSGPACVGKLTVYENMDPQSALSEMELVTA